MCCAHLYCLMFSSNTILFCSSWGHCMSTVCAVLPSTASCSPLILYLLFCSSWGRCMSMVCAVLTSTASCSPLIQYLLFCSSWGRCMSTVCAVLTFTASCSPLDWTRMGRTTKESRFGLATYIYHTYFCHIGNEWC